MTTHTQAALDEAEAMLIDLRLQVTDVRCRIIADKLAAVRDVAFSKGYADGYGARLAELEAVRAESAGLVEALTPNAETKAAYMGEFQFPFPVMGEDGEEMALTPNVPWTTIKDIMSAIRAFALAKATQP